MKTPKHFALVIISTVLYLQLFSQAPTVWGELKKGDCEVGFKLIETVDNSRVFNFSIEEKEYKPRPLRIHLWYPSKQKSENYLTVDSYLKICSEDFVPIVNLPVQLQKGLGNENLEQFSNKQTASILNAIPEYGNFPLIIIGQGLYFESPLSHFILCEYLASHGYIVATSALFGTHNRLVNLNVQDLETQIRDMEFIIAEVKKQKITSSNKTGIIGFDLGGMSGMILTMRNPGIAAFISLDAGILYEHFSGLPGIHQNYNLDNFRVPWLHITQSRFIQDSSIQTTMSKKKYGDNYLVTTNTTNHANFTSYSICGIENPVPAYWGEIADDLESVYIEICDYSKSFLDQYLKQINIGLNPNKYEYLSTLFKKGCDNIIVEDDLINQIIVNGVKTVYPIIRERKRNFPSEPIIEETKLNWLGYHFLYWWGREKEAIDVFKLLAELYPDSLNAYDSLGESYYINGQTDLAIINYEKSLELNPDNENAKEMLLKLKN
ncbi:MAG: tetratricopeptide repeat protein [ANME-2 cluster archaeon]|nr:MAG: tetratricopeptide repeat protein [ANME-2 cluster archaeon]